MRQRLQSTKSYDNPKKEKREKGIDGGGGVFEAQEVILQFRHCQVKCRALSTGHESNKNSNSKNPACPFNSSCIKRDRW